VSAGELDASGPVIGGVNPPAGAIASLDALVAELRIEESRSYGHRLSAASSLRIRTELVRRWGEPRWAPRAFALAFALLCLVISLRAVTGRPRAAREQSYNAAIAVDAASDLDASAPFIGAPAGAIASLNALEPTPSLSEQSGGPRELP